MADVVGTTRRFADRFVADLLDLVGTGG